MKAWCFWIGVGCCLALMTVVLVGARWPVVWMNRERAAAGRP
jgi:hypothetical protein